MDNPEKLETSETRRRQTKQKYNTICVGHHYTQTNTNKVNNSWTSYKQLGWGCLVETEADC